MIPQFIGAFLAGSALIVGASFLWPKLTGQARPQLLEDVHEKALETDAGRRAEDVLGITDPENVQKIDIGSVSASVVKTVTTEVQKKSEEIIEKRIIEELVRRVEVLPADQKQEVQKIICAPANEE